MSIETTSGKISETDFLQNLFKKAVSAAAPENCLTQALSADKGDESLSALLGMVAAAGGEIYVIGVGKAAASMAVAFENWLSAQSKFNEMAKSGCVITPYDHGSKTQWIDVVEARHPTPDENGLLAARKIMTIAKKATERDIVICLISGGGSSLLCAPADGITLAEKTSLNKELLKSGAPISEMNCVRKHLSAVKGGRLAALAAPANVVSYFISDVPGDALDVIASGPTVLDPSARHEALEILSRYDVDASDDVIAWLQDPRSETPKRPEEFPKLNQHNLIITPMEVLNKAAAYAKEQGIQSYILSDRIEGEARDVASVLAAIARDANNTHSPFMTPCVIISGGETTVTIKGKGRGGRNVEFLLSLAIQLEGTSNIFALSADTDGIDGIEAIAGAFIHPNSLADAKEIGLNPSSYLDNNDSHTFFEKLGCNIVTGPTKTNVNDFRALLIT